MEFSGDKPSITPLEQWIRRISFFEEAQLLQRSDNDPAVFADGTVKLQHCGC